MKGFFEGYILYICALIFFSCEKNNFNDSIIIPPLPNQADLNKQKAALKILNDEISNNNSNLELYFKRAKLYLDDNQVDNANEDIKKILSKDPNIAKYRLLNSEILRAKSNFALALNEAKLAELLGLKTPETYSLLSDLSQKLNKINEAKKYINYALKIAPHNGEVYYYNATLMIKTKDTTEAIENLKLAKLYKPKFVNSYKRLSEIYNNQGNTDLAKEISFQLAKQYPNDPENCMIIAKIYQRKMIIDSAIIFYKKALQIKPNYYQASYDAGILCLRNRYYADALTFFEITYKFAPKTPFIHTNIGMCLENMGNAKKALESYTLAFAINNIDYKAIEGIKRLEVLPTYPNQLLDYAYDKNYKKNSTKTTNIDTTKIRISEIQPKRISTTKRDSSRLQNTNKFKLPTIK